MDENGLVPINKVADKLGVSVAAIRGWVNQGKIPEDTYIKIGNTYRFDLKRILDLLLYKTETLPPETKTTPTAVTVVVTDDNLDIDL